MQLLRSLSKGASLNDAITNWSTVLVACQTYVVSEERWCVCVCVCVYKANGGESI
jgi:hypothetical protein